MSETENGKKEVRVEVLSKLRAGEQPFSAWGYSSLKVLRNDEEIELRVPIKSIGLAEAMERINRRIPSAPIRRELIKKNSDEGRALGYGTDRIVEVESAQDPEYIEKLKRYNQQSMWEMILSGLAVDIVDKDPNGNEIAVVESNETRSATVIKDVERAIAILKSLGITDDQAGQLYRDIKNLTNKEQERVDQE